MGDRLTAPPRWRSQSTWCCSMNASTSRAVSTSNLLAAQDEGRRMIEGGG